MNSIKCPKCGFMTFSTAVSCKNCRHQFSAADSLNKLKTSTPNAEQPMSGADAFCAVNLVAVSIVTGVVFCLYWNSMVLSQFLPSGRYPLILLVIFYLPAGILAIGCGIAWFALLRSVLKGMGLNVSE